MFKAISSVQNPKVKQILLLLEKSRERKKSGKFVIEGRRELQLALKSGYELESVLLCSTIFSEDVGDYTTANSEVIEISEEVYQKLAYRDSTEGIMAIAKSKDHNLTAIDFDRPNPLILVAEAPEKPGNIGALLRTADAANVDAIIIANPRTDLYNPNIIRSSVGCVFTRTIALGTSSEVIEYLKDHKISIFCAALQDSVPYHTCNFKKASAIVVGTEADGLSDEWLKNGGQNIVIPMHGEIDSMNVSVAAGILIFEVKRQRNFR